MNISPQKQEEPDVNLTPMIDVVFLLLLFFMVSTSFIRESSLKVDLPQAAGSALIEQAQPIDIIISADGKFIINKITLDNPSSQQLADVLQQAAGDNNDPHIIISADADAAYQNIVTAMDTAQRLGYTKLTLATRQTSKSTQ